MCSFTKKSFSFWGLRPPDPLPGLCPWTPLRDFRPPDFFCSPNNPVRSMPLYAYNPNARLLSRPQRTTHVLCFTLKSGDWQICLQHVLCDYNLAIILIFAAADLWLCSHSYTGCKLGSFYHKLINYVAYLTVIISLKWCIISTDRKSYMIAYLSSLLTIPSCSKYFAFCNLFWILYFENHSIHWLECSYLYLYIRLTEQQERHVWTLTSVTAYTL